MGIEANLRASFRDVKLDMISIKTQFMQLVEDQKELRDMIIELQKSKIKKSSGKKKSVKKAKETGSINHASYVCSKEGKKVHIIACPFAKNIKPKSRVVFKSKEKALNEGYKPCECMKKL